MNKGGSHTSQSLNPNGVVPFSSRLITSKILPVAPDSDILQALVVMPIFEVFCRHETISTRGVDEIFKGNISLLAVTVLVGGSDRTTFGVVTLKLDGKNFGVFEHLDARGLGMTKEKVVKFRSDLTADDRQSVTIHPLITTRHAQHSMNRILDHEQ